MNGMSIPPETAGLEIPKNTWTQPFWDAAARSELRLPSCADCGTHRWPPGPFCPSCRSQAVEWTEAGPAVLYSYTIVAPAPSASEAPAGSVVPGLVAFPQSGGVRIMAPIIHTPLRALRIGAALDLRWLARGETNLPAFAILEADTAP